MVDQFPLFVSADEASRPTTIAAYVSGVDTIPESVGGTGVSAFSSTVSALASATVGFSINAAGNTVTLNPGVNELDLGTGSQKVVARHIHYANQLSGHTDSTALLDGSLSAMKGISAPDPWGFSSVDAGGKLFFLRRKDSATYENLIRADDGTITLQAEDDIHLKSNSGEDFARFNENAAVWLYYDNSKKIETNTQGAVVTGGVSATGSVSSVTATLTSSASVSGCPFPPPFSYIAANADLGTGVDNFYFGSGVSITSTSSTNDGIIFDSTNGYWVIADAGWYEVRGDIAQNVTVSPTTVTNYVITTTGYGGTEAVKSASYSVLRTNIDPHLTIAHWIGYLTAGVNLAIKCDASTGLMKSERGSTASVKRIG